MHTTQPTHPPTHPHSPASAGCDAPSQDVACMFAEDIQAPAGSYNSLTHQVAFCKMQGKTSPLPTPPQPPTHPPTYPPYSSTQRLRHRLPRDERGPVCIYLGPGEDWRRPGAQPVWFAGAGLVAGPARRRGRVRDVLGGTVDGWVGGWVDDKAFCMAQLNHPPTHPPRSPRSRTCRT